ncbi:MAG: AAA family ATPase, partial [Gemmatimonadota bacterium]|nr:AAA family ATPase [Gemmatimonadota bacterium]
MKKQLGEVWDALRASQRHRDDALSEVRIRKLRGIEDLRVPFQYPVSVLAGPNGCGKSTVLFACACAYRVPGRGPREFTPTSLFPNFTNQQPGDLSDSVRRTELEFHYVYGGDRLSMVWRRRKSWNRSYMGRKGGMQPEREVYLRTLANLTNPSEVRGILQLGRKDFETRTLSPELLIFAHRILPWRYRNLAIISDRPTRDLLFADLDGTASYSEFHMSSGERSVLRISKDISELSNALVLIDEVDTGLHPYTQQQTMLELQRSALRQGLQVVVASHSPVVIDSVPPEGR